MGAKVAKTVAEAQVGELPWRCDPQANLYDASRKYEGRGVWSLKTVLEVQRLSVVVGDPEYPSNAPKYDRTTGSIRGSKGYGSNPFVRGSKDREDGWWLGQRHELAKKVQHCDDLEVLKTIAFATGCEGPPDFTGVVPSPGVPASLAGRG